jgi:rhodanese-related sulfurtransferase
MASRQPDAPAPRSIPEISREKVLARLGDPSLALVNVLPREAFAASRIPGSLSLPVPEIPQRAREVLPRPSQEIAVYCASST